MGQGTTAPDRPGEDAAGKTILWQPQPRWRMLDGRELLHYRDLFFFLTWRSIKVRYAQSALGIGWAVVQPLASVLVYTVVFGKLVGVASEGQPYALFAFVALLPWQYFSNAVNLAARSLSANAPIISKVYFPRVMLPFSAVAARLLDFFIAFGFLILFLLLSGRAPGWGLLCVVPLIFLALLAAGGFGLWLTALSIQYRDINHATTFAVQLLMYATPVVYPLSLVPEGWRLLYALNPMVGVVEGFRAALLPDYALAWDLFGIGVAVSVAVTVTGLIYFHRKEPVFADVA